MSKGIIRLYVNNPMGGRWTQNITAAGQAESDFGATVVIIRKTSDEYLNEKDAPPCPSVAVNGKLIVENGTVSYEQLSSALSDKA